MNQKKEPLNEILSMMSRIDESYPETVCETGETDSNSDNANNRINLTDNSVNIVPTNNTNKIPEEKDFFKKIISQRKDIIKTYPNPENDFKHYNLALIKRLCVKMMQPGGEYIVDTTISADKIFDKDISDWRKEYDKICKENGSCIYKNKNIRKGYAFEMLLGNVPDWNSEADLQDEDKHENGEEDGDTEAKTASNELGCITVSNNRISNVIGEIENINDSIKDSYKELELKVTEWIKKETGLNTSNPEGIRVCKRSILNKSIRTDLALIYYSDTCYKVCVKIEEGDFYRDKIPLKIEITKGVRKEITKGDRKEITKGDRKYYKNKYMPSSATTNYFYIPYWVSAGKIVQKIPNLVIGFGNAWDDIEKGLHYYKFYDYKIYKYNKEKEYNEYNNFKKLFNKVFNLYVGLEYSKEDKRFYFRMVPEINYQEFKNEVQNGGIYEEYKG